MDCISCGLKLQQFPGHSVLDINRHCYKLVKMYSRLESFDFCLAAFAADHDGNSQASRPYIPVNEGNTDDGFQEVI